MRTRFHFADAFWFRLPLKTIVVTLAVFAILSLYPAVGHGTSQDQQRAIFGFTVLSAFIVMASVFAVAIDDSHLSIEGDEVHIHFEAFFNTRFPIADIAAVREVHPRRQWRYRFGLSTNFEDRISCSHGGRLVEIELTRPCSRGSGHARSPSGGSGSPSASTTISSRRSPQSRRCRNRCLSRKPHSGAIDPVSWP